MDVRTTVRPRANRAVAALTDADSGIAALTTALLAAAPDPSTLHAPITRYRSLTELETARRQRWPSAPLYEEWKQLQSRPHPRDELAALPGAALISIFQFLGPLSADSGALAACCRRARQMQLCHGGTTTVSLVPDLLPTAERLAKPRVLPGLYDFFSPTTRGPHVRRLALIGGRHAAKHPSAAKTPRPHLSLPATLQLVAQLTYLQYLDVRGVDWSASRANATVAACFLADLHLVAPRLHTLKLGKALCRQWPQGWWQRLLELTTLVVSSRPEEAGSSAPLNSAAVTVTAAAAEAAPLSLGADFVAMISSGQRPWRVTVWSPLTRESVVRLLGIPSAGGGAASSLLAMYPSLRELGLNLQGNTEVCAWLTDGGPDTGGSGAAAVAASAAAGSDGTGKTKMKPKRGAAPDAIGDPPVFPALTTLTIANVEERVLSAAELLSRFYVIAPSLVCFNVCNTTRLPLLEKPKGKKRAVAATVDAA